MKYALIHLKYDSPISGEASKLFDNWQILMAYLPTFLEKINVPLNQHEQAIKTLRTDFQYEYTSPTSKKTWCAEHKVLIVKLTPYP